MTTNTVGNKLNPKVKGARAAPMVTAPATAAKWNAAFLSLLILLDFLVLCLRFSDLDSVIDLGSSVSNILGPELTPSGFWGSAVPTIGVVTSSNETERAKFLGSVL